MSTLKKILSLSLALAMLMSVSVFAGFADEATIDADAKAAVELLTAVKILNGIEKEDGTFDFAPTATIKRGEAAKMIYVLRNGGVDDKAETWKGVVSFADCKDHWAAGYIAYCEAYGLIDGRTETVFDPEAPVTGVELAKMLLTTAGYNTEVEGFTGTNWAKNVVAEANSVELFKGVEFAISEAAPRQWAAVMFKNAFKVKVPTYIGDYRVDGILTGVTAQTVQAKFLNFDDSLETYVLATPTAAMPGQAKAASGKTVLASSTVDFVVSDALVGQQVKVTTINGKIVTIAPTGKTVMGKLTIGAKVTASGENQNKYPIYIDGALWGYRAGDANLTVDVVSAGVNGLAAKETITVADLKTAIEAKTTTIKVIGYDKDGNNAALEGAYAVIDEYVEITDTQTTGDNKGQFTIGALTVKKDGKIGTEAANIQIAAQDGLVAKVTKDMFTGKITVAAANIAGGKLTAISGTKYTIGGEQYEISANDINTSILGLSGMNKDLVVFTDGKYIVLAKEATSTSTPSTPATPTVLPEQLAYVIDGAKVKVGEKDVTDSWGAVTGKQDVFAYKLLVLLKGESKEQQVVYYEATGSSDKTLENSYTVANLFDGNALKADYVGGVFEYAKVGEKIHLKKDLGKVTGYKFFAAEGTAPVDKLTNVTGAMGDIATYDKNSKLFTGLADNVFVIGSEDAIIFAHYEYEKNGSTKHEYKFIKVSDLANYTVEEFKMIAATGKTIGEVAIATAELAPKGEEVAEEVPAYILATSAAVLEVEGDKIYAKFNAINLKTGAVENFKLVAKTETVAMYEKIKAGQIFEIETTNGLVTEVGDAETTAKWNRGKVTAAVADLLLIDGAIVETKGDNKGFTTDCKIIVKNGSTYTLGGIDQIGVAGKDSSGNFYNNLLFVKSGDKFAYVIVDMDGNLEVTVNATTNVITVK